MSRMAEHYQDEQDQQSLDDMSECERWHWEQTQLEADPGYRTWCAKIEQQRKEIDHDYFGF